MRKWGAIVSVAYAVIVLGLLIPGAMLLVNHSRRYLWGDILSVYKEWVTWIFVGVLLAGQALLLFLSVDTSWQRLRPRAHILVSSLAAGSLSALLMGAAGFSLGMGIWGDHFGGKFFEDGVNIAACWGALWLAWLIVFYVYFRNPNAQISRVTAWLLTGSVLELLIAVPAHVIARRRNDCSAPAVTSFGIASGIAIMLLSFGPSVFLLYKKRLDGYAKRKTAAG